MDTLTENKKKMLIDLVKGTKNKDLTGQFSILKRRKK